MGNIYQAITAIMDEGYAITKGKRNQQQGFMYRGIDDVMNTFQPLLAKHHVFVVPEVLEQTRMERAIKEGKTILYSVLRMKYTFFAEDGSSVSAIVVGEGMDSGDKASNKAMAVAMKYAMFQVFCIPTEEMPDPDGDTPPPTTPVNNQETIYFTCEKCRKRLKPYKDAAGNTVPIRKHVARSQEKFGKTYCIGCIEEMNHGTDQRNLAEKKAP